jgi:bacteriophage N4 adsorption protein A
MRLFSAILLTVLTVPVVASAQAIDLGPDMSGYTRFVVYPHLQKGLDSMQRGDRDRAFSELERARSLAPENATVALHLAAAYRKFGETERAERLLREQLKRTPSDARVKSTLAEIEAASRPVAVSGAAASAAPVATVAKARPARVVTARKPSRARRAVSPRTVPTPASVSHTVPIPAPPDVRTQAQARFTTAVSERRIADAEAAGNELLALDVSPAMLDDVSFKLVDAGASEEALRVLLQAYPFTTADAAQRDVLLQRMIPLVEHHRGELADVRFQLLRLPLDTPALRSRQGVFWTSVGDCETVRAVLGDLSPEYGHDDWVRLGHCAATADPVLARHAYATAHAMNPGGKGSMALAYAAFAAGDYRASLDAWRTIGRNGLAGDELLAASTTALAAGEDREALDWLETHRTSGNTLDHRYWSLLGRGRMRADAAGAIAAFERAVALRPDVDDLRRLAQLETEPAKRVDWLEQAVDLAPSDAGTQAELGYAYARTGRAAASLEAFEKSMALDPTNTGVQVELGFAYWRAGRTADAARVLEHAYQADPSNMMVARQLVYAEQRLANNGAAQRYAERVLDTPEAFTAGASDLTPLEQADLRFGFQRLHEDLGRRVTVNLDGFSGTRVGASPPSAQPGSHYRSYAQIEADVRLGKETIRDGTTVSAYARVFADGGDLHRAFPSDNAVLGAGLRWKPWRSHVVYLAAEGQNGLDDGSRRDVLLRASASFLNGGRFGDDWHPARTGWFSQNLYLDAARYLKSDFSAFTADYRTSYHKRVAGGNTVEPYTHVQFNVSGSQSLERDVRAGAGVRWNIWHGGSNYDADPHKLSLGVEFQHAFETYLPDRNGLFLTLGSRW